MVARKPALSSKAAGKVKDAIGAMEAHQKKLSYQPFKASELLALFVNPDHHHVLTQAYHLCEPTGHVQELFVACEVPLELGGGKAHMRFRWHGLNTPHAFYVPYRVGSQVNYPAVVREDAPGELRERFEQVSQEMIRTAHDFAYVARTFAKLNKPGVCETLAQLRYHWPCILPILRRTIYDDMCDAVIDPSSRAGDMARIPRDLFAAVKATNEIVARFEMISDVPTPKISGIEYDLLDTFRR